MARAQRSVAMVATGAASGDCPREGQAAAMAVGPWWGVGQDRACVDRAGACPEGFAWAAGVIRRHTRLPRPARGFHRG